MQCHSWCSSCKHRTRVTCTSAEPAPDASKSTLLIVDGSCTRHMSTENIKYLCQIQHSWKSNLRPKKCAGHLWTTCSNFFKIARHFRHLKSSETTDYVKHVTRTKFGECGFSHSGPAERNSLPSHLRTIIDTNVFKRHLKAFPVYWVVCIVLLALLDSLYSDARRVNFSCHTVNIDNGLHTTNEHILH